jgi:hypothetical protein
MTTKKTAPRKGSHPVRNAEQLRKLSQQARAEVARLLAQDRAGNITRRQLQTGLKEIQQELKRIMIFTHKL